MDVGKITVRRDPVGGPQLDHVREVVGSLSGKRTVLILIHGYNNSEKVATDAFDTFIDHLNKLGTSPVQWTFQFFWPGDTPNKIISTISFPAEITPAIDSGKRLAEYLSGLSGPAGTPIEIHIVSHSLGNRVTLELFQRLMSLPGNNAVIRTLTLMAGAVPVSRVDKNGELREAAMFAARTNCLHSKSDSVLHFAFPLGEMASGEGFLPQAVGRFGNPSATWSGGSEMFGYGHSDYWVKDESCASAAGTIGWPVTPPIASSAQMERQLPASNVIAERTIAGRQLLPRII